MANQLEARVKQLEERIARLELLLPEAPKASELVPAAVAAVGDGSQGGA